MIVNGVLFFCKQKTAYEMRISDRRSDVCSSDLLLLRARRLAGAIQRCDAGAETRTFRYRAAELLWHRQSLLDRQSESRRRYRPGIVMIEHDADHETMRDYTDAGVCGIRLDLFKRAELPLEEIEAYITAMVAKVAS